MAQSKGKVVSAKSSKKQAWSIKRVSDGNKKYSYAVTLNEIPVAYTQRKADAEFILLSYRTHSDDKKYTTQLTDQMKRGHLSLYLLDRAIAYTKTGIVLADATQKDLPLIYVNPAFEEITGYKFSEVIGKNCRFLQGPDRKQAGLKVLRKTLKEGKDCNVVIRNYRKDQTQFWNELQISPIHDDKGNLTHFVGIQTDVTKRVEDRKKLIRLQKELRQRNAELEELNQVKMNFWEWPRMI